MTPRMKELVRELPSVSALLKLEEVNDWLGNYPRATVVASLQSAVSDARDAILSEQLRETIDVAALLKRAGAELHKRSVPSLRRVINATGIILHTGLGRAPLSDAAIEAIVEGCSGYCNLEYDLHSGKRGARHSHVVAELAALTGAESATVVNNNAAATLLILQTFAAGKEAVVSRGELIEIGGSFRLPDIMRAGGVTLHEVGTTNRTRLSDFEGAINDRTAVLMAVHTSNYRIVGFTESVPIDALAALARRFGLIALHDLGSGAMLDSASHGLPDEPCVKHSLDGGADLVCFSGDKLMGGPQCGVILGRKGLIDALNANPLMRTYRVDKLTLVALEATLRAYREPEHALTAIPTLAMISASTEELAARAQRLCERLESAVPSERFYIGSDVAYAGGGSMPQRELQTIIVQWRPRNSTANDIVRALRERDVPVIARIRDDAVCFDLRTVPESQFDGLVASVSASVSASGDQVGG